MDTTILNSLQTAIKRGLDWLVAQDAKINEIKDFAAHYKAAYLYAVTGMPERSRKYAELLATSYLRKDGDLRMSDDVKGWQHMPASPHNRYIYGNGWAVAGLQKIGAYGVVAKALPFLEKFQDPLSGGFYSRYDIKQKKIDRSRTDTSSTCSGTLALLACGKFEQAVKGADYLVRMMEDQPQRDRFFFTTLVKESGIFTDVFHNEDATAFDSRKHFCVSTEHNALYEMVWFLGMPMKILGLVYEVTSDKKYLDCAAQYFNFFNKLSSERWQNNSGTKIMWGTSELYHQTKKTEYYDAAVRYATWLTESQLESGEWVHSLWYKSIEEQPFQVTLDLVQVYVSEFCDTLYAICR